MIELLLIMSGVLLGLAGVGVYHIKVRVEELKAVEARIQALRAEQEEAIKTLASLQKETVEKYTKVAETLASLKLEVSTMRLSGSRYGK